MAMAFSQFVASILDTHPRPGLHPIPETKPLTLEAIICPPLVYYVALLFLPSAPPHAIDTTTIKLLRSILALLAGILFFRLPLKYHVAQSIGLTYQLSLVGLYGGCRVLDAFFISPYLFGHVPRRIRYEHRARVQTPAPQLDIQTASREAQCESVKEYEESKSIKDKVTDNIAHGGDVGSYFLSRTLTGPEQEPVTETQISEDGWPHHFFDRASWALELELSMRGVGFTWTTADVRHTRKTWLPTIASRLHSIFIHVLPTTMLAFVIIRHVYTNYLENPSGPDHSFDTALSFPTQLLLTAALGAFLMSSFSLAHSVFAIMLSPLAPHPLAFFPPLYTTRIWDIVSVRTFWSYGWHRLFARLFLVYGVWPGEWLERKILRKPANAPADMGKVIGGFASSAFVHSFAVRSVLAGQWTEATGEARFFLINGFAVVFEEVVRRWVINVRKRNGNKDTKGRPATTMWYDAWIGRIWWIAILLVSGRNFARGWVKAGLIREMAGK